MSNDYGIEYYTGDYTLLFNNAVPKDACTPVLTLNNLLEFVNYQILPKPRCNHNDGEQNALARIVRLNWMVENLKHNPIAKPIVVFCKFTNWNQPESDDVWEVMVGDTRLQALELVKNITTVPLLVQVPVFHRKYYPDYQVVPGPEQLKQLLNLQSQDKILCRVDWNSEPIDWIEFDMYSTIDHMHNEDQRLKMAYNYLDSQSSDFVFDRDWLCKPIDWSLYDH